MAELPAIVDAAWVAERLGAPGIVLADVRWMPDGSARRDYEAGHIPGAVFADVDSDLAAPPWSGPGRHPLPSPEAFAHAMSALGIGDDDDVIAYDDDGGSSAARLWWMLTGTGHAAAVLDGGLATWTGPLQKGTVKRASREFAARTWPAQLIVDADGVAAALREGAPVLDARAPERYRGDAEPIDKVAGHIPGARSAPWEANLGEDGRFLAPDELRRRYLTLGAGKHGPAIAYCGSGVTACHDVLAMRLAGLGLARLYEGSWSDWSSEPDRPIATGEK